MPIRRISLTFAFLTLLAGPTFAADGGQFVVRLGRDTTGVEHWDRTATQLVVNQVGRSPRVLRRHYTYDYVNGALTHVQAVVTAPGSETPVQTIDAAVDGDSVRLQIKAPQGQQSLAVAVPPGALVVPSSSPWAAYEGEFMKLAVGKSDSLRGNMYYLGAPSSDWYVVRRAGKDSVSLTTSHLDVFRARVDAAGHVLGMRPITGTGKFSLERVSSLDLDAMAASFTAEEHAGAGLGQLSPRDTVRSANAGGANLWVDYGRPGKRGRTIFGDVVPYGEIWRTGANAATQFKTDRALDFGGGVVVPAGFYTLWSLPTAAGWKLIVNSETGQWGTAHNSAKDLYTIELKREALPEVAERFTIGIQPSATGGVMTFDWDRTRGSAAFTVQP